MERSPVQSSNVAEVGYDPASMTLEVLFHNGSIYRYFDVPQAVYSELMSAASVGAYLNSQIKNQYRYARM
jgi:hypothetical protein